ncbi:hydantoinase B/oxoprolinase family protein [Arthrobacter sp. NtRootA1]|uniref:hydantoinase B/oxoprolinase family protein n=1 Tax=Arthrobacter sp. NtRootA1 TaxID=2830983 RepID=UPI001CC5659D|nr:hydantoinase B/oxoprolinase family protein [Arthrobacter sp. NtRootA1]BCW05951.1 methylhydantoinase [Arthrobacter sp. NtRootA1]
MSRPDVDPLSLAVIRGRLEQIADEMDTVFERMAFSPVISDAWDRADGIYSAKDGSMIVQGIRGLPIFVGTMQYTVASVLNIVKEPRPGDTYLVNDPFAGGTHIMDTKLVRPYFYNGKLFAMLANTGHWTDLGGRVPGGFAAQASDCYQEGLRIPPVRLFTQDTLNTDILAILQTNSRLPDDIMGDVEAQATALRVGDERLTELLDEYGPELVSNVIDLLRERSALQMRSYIRDIPDGSYSFTERMDNDGINDALLDVAVRLTISGDEMTIDFSESSPPCEGPMNSVYAATVSSAIVAIKHVFPDIPINSGIFEPLSFVIPESVFLNAKPPRPVAGCAAETSQRIITAVMGALAGALPDRVPAGSSATSNNLSIGGVDEDGEQFVMYTFLGGGYGGHQSGDGLSNGCSLMSIGLIQSVETLEQRYPILVRQYSLRDESAGAGTFRGGLGVHFEFEYLGKHGRASLLGDQSKTAPVGRMGGQPGATSAPWFRLRGEKVTLPMVSKGENVRITQGDIICMLTPGGGGYGDPARRSKQAIAGDIEAGYATSD